MNTLTLFLSPLVLLLLVSYAVVGSLFAWQSRQHDVFGRVGSVLLGALWLPALALVLLVAAGDVVRNRPSPWTWVDDEVKDTENGR